MDNPKMYDKNVLDRKIKLLSIVRNITGVLCGVCFLLALPAFVYKFPSERALIVYIAFVVIIIATLFIINNRLADKVKRLVDYKNTGVITEPEKKNRDQLIHKLCEGLFCAGILGMILTVFLSIRTTMNSPVFLIISFGLCIILCTVGFIFGFKAQNKIQQQLLPDIAQKVQPRVAGVIVPGVFQANEHVKNKYAAGDVVEGNCYAAGRHNGYSVEFSNLKLSHYELRRSSGTNGSSERIAVTDFNGICIAVYNTKPISESVPERLLKELEKYSFYRVAISQPNVLVVLIPCSFLFVTQYGPNRVKSDSEIEADIRMLNQILFDIERVISES